MIPSRWTLRRLQGHFLWLRRKNPLRPLVATHTHTQAAVPFHVGTWHANDVSRGAWRVRVPQLFLKETGTFLVTSFWNFDVWSWYNLCSRVPPGEHMSWKQQLLKDPWRMKTGTCWKDQKLPLLIVLRFMSALQPYTEVSKNNYFIIFFIILVIMVFIIFIIMVFLMFIICWRNDAHNVNQNGILMRNDDQNDNV